MNSTKTHFIVPEVASLGAQVSPTKNDRSRQIDPNIDNIVTSVGIHVERYQCDEIDTIV